MPVLVTDSECDLPAGLFAGLGAEVVYLHFLLDGAEYPDDFGQSMAHAEFYRRLRAGAQPTSTAVPLADYLDVFTRCAEAGRPALLLGLSSKLSSSYEASLTAAKMVMDSHPGADIRVVDSLCASAALGFLVWHAAGQIRGGATIDELETWALDARHRVNGYFTVETLEYLRRGGRIPDVVAFAGMALDLRPILRLDPAGGLVFVSPARGRRKSIRAMVDIAVQRATDAASSVVFIAHGDAPEDAEEIRRQLLEHLPFREVVICELGPVIATHSGPGMLAVVFWGPER